MISKKQRDALHAQIWKIANEVRGAVDGWDFKQYILGTLFYRFISENFATHMEGGEDSINYAALEDTEITAEIKEEAVKTKGYFIYPSQLFANVAKNAANNENLNTDLAKIFSAIEGSASGHESESAIKGLFSDFDTTSSRLGATVKEKNVRLTAVLKGIAGLEFGDIHAHQIDLFGDAYEFLISNYAANAGKSGGEFFTPQQVSKLIVRLALHGQSAVNKIYDPACGSGSLLLQAQKDLSDPIIEDGYFGQEINPTTYNLARMNMFLHNIDYNDYQLLIVAEKYQTGFDQPKLCAMYVDRKLDGLQAVQTLSRLNRTCVGKTKTFVLDFQNSIEDIQNAFRPFFEATSLEAITDPNQIYELEGRIKSFSIIDEDEVNRFAETYYKDLNNTNILFAIKKILKNTDKIF